jgi:hypothetical protein
MMENEGCRIRKRTARGSAHEQFCRFSVWPEGQETFKQVFCPKRGLAQVSNPFVILLHCDGCGLVIALGPHIGLFANLKFHPPIYPSAEEGPKSPIQIHIDTWCLNHHTFSLNTEIYKTDLC